MTEKKLDEILFKLKRLDGIEDAMIELSDNQKKIYALLAPESQETVRKEFELPETKESVEAEVGVITEKAVGILNHDKSKICWIPKKAIKNLDKIAIEQGKRAELTIENWFQSKVKWVENKPRG